MQNECPQEGVRPEGDQLSPPENAIEDWFRTDCLAPEEPPPQLICLVGRQIRNVVFGPLNALTQKQRVPQR